MRHHSNTKYAPNSASHSQRRHSACRATPTHTLPHAREPFDLTRMAVVRARRRTPWNVHARSLVPRRPTDRQTDRTARQAEDERPSAVLSVRLGKGVSCPKAHRADALSQNGYGFLCFFLCFFFFVAEPPPPHFYSVFSKNAKFRERQKRKKKKHTLFVSTPVRTALVKMSFFVHFSFLLFFCNFHFFRDVFDR